MKTENITLSLLDLKTITIPIEGITPYLSEKENPEIAESYNKKKALKKTEKDIRLEEDKIEEKIHYDSDGNVCIPSAAFYKGMIEVSVYDDSMNKKLVAGSVKFLENLVPITFESQETNIAIGRTSGMSKAPRKIVRPQFNKWRCELNIRYNANLISPEQIYNLVNLAGFQMGVGGWRPQKSGNYGQYKIDV